MADFVGLELRGARNLDARLKGAMGKPGYVAGLRAASKVFIEDDLKRYPPYRYVPQEFTSEKHQRWFFWALRQGIITVPYSRTGAMREGWRALKFRAESVLIVNEEPAAVWAKGDETQTDAHRRRGWRTVGEDLRRAAQKLARIVARHIERAMGGRSK